MKELLITIDYEDPTNKYWNKSTIKNKIIKFNPEYQSIHQLIYELCDRDFITLSYNGKPQNNVHIDINKEESKLIGYTYRGKGVFEGKKVLFDVWVTIYEVIDFKIEEVWIK